MTTRGYVVRGYSADGEVLAWGRVFDRADIAAIVAETAAHDPRIVDVAVTEHRRHLVEVWTVRDGAP